MPVKRKTNDASVRALGGPGRDLWLEIVRRSGYATYFHTPDWSDLMSEVHADLTVCPEAFRLADGTIAVLPLLARKVRGFFRGCESMFPGVYGGPIAERELSNDEVQDILALAVKPRTSYLRIFGNPYLQAFRPEDGGAEEFTHVIDLADGFEAVFSRFHQNHRRTYKAGLRSGLVVDQARSLDDFRDYFRVYQRDRERWGDRSTTNDTFDLFAAIHRRRDARMILWLARTGGRVVAGDLFLYWNDHCVGWHGAADPAAFDRHPTNFLLTEILHDACGRGLRWFDFNPSGGHSGVVAFKDSFGAERRYFRHAVRPGSALYRLAVRVERFFRVRAPRALRRASAYRPTLGR